MLEIVKKEHTVKIYGEEIVLREATRSVSKEFRKACKEHENNPDGIVDAGIDVLVKCGLKKELTEELTDQNIMHLLMIVMPQEKKS